MKNKSKSNSKLLLLAGIIGNALDHYDTALYIYMAPFLSTLFFPDHDPVTSLIKAHAVTAIGILIRPIGSFIFGKLALKYYSSNLLSITLCGVAVCTFLMGFIPDYNAIGIFAPILLVTIRFIQGVFAAGEYTISSLFVLENTSHTKYGRTSSYYICSTMAGVMLASFAATLVSKSQDPTYYWRIAFIIGLFTALFGLILRIIVIKTKIIAPKDLPETVNIVIHNKYKMLQIIILSSFSFLTFTLPFIFFNNFIPLITPYTRDELLTHNTILLAVDIALLPIAGILVDKFNHIKWMTCFAIPLTISMLPIFYFLPSMTLIEITLVKLWIIVLGLAFAVPLKVLLFKMIKGREKFLITGFGYALGTELLGRSTTAIGLTLWKATDSVIAPGLYITFVCLLTCCVLIYCLFCDKSDISLCAT